MSRSVYPIIFPSLSLTAKRINKNFTPVAFAFSSSVEVDISKALCTSLESKVDGIRLTPLKLDTQAKYKYEQKLLTFFQFVSIRRFGVNSSNFMFDQELIEPKQTKIAYHCRCEYI